MDKDRIAGAAKQAVGAVKEVAGKVMGDAKLNAEGKAEKVEGKIQNAVGGARDAARERVLVLRLDDEVDVIVLHREVDDAQETFGRRPEGVEQARHRTTTAEARDPTAHLERDEYRLTTGEVGACGMRDAGTAPQRRPTPCTAARASVGTEPDLALTAVPLLGHVDETSARPTD